MNKLLIRNVNKRVNYIIFKIKMKLIIASIFGRRNIMYAIKKNTWKVHGEEDTYLIDTIYERLIDEGYYVHTDELPCWRRLFIKY